VAGLDASKISSAVYVSAAGTVYLLVCDGTSVYKIDGTTDSAITGLPAITPSSVSVAGRRVFFSQANTLLWSIFNPTLTTAGEWPTDNEISIADIGIRTITAMVEFGGFLYVFGDNAVAQIDPRDPLTNNEIILTGYGISALRNVVSGPDRIYFSDAIDVYEWVPGGPPRSIASAADGSSLVRGILVDAAGSDPYKAMGYDFFRDILFISSNSETLAYFSRTMGWARWQFGADCWTFLSNVSYLTESTLTETLMMDWTKNQDTIAGSASQFQWKFRTANRRPTQEGNLAIKKIRVGFPGDTSLSAGEADVVILKDGGNTIANGTISLEVDGVFTLDSSLLDGEDVLGGSGNEVWDYAAFPYPQGNTIGVQLSATDNNPFTVYSLIAQAQERHLMPAGI
jgi:hypothetical protein